MALALTPALSAALANAAYATGHLIAGPQKSAEAYYGLSVVRCDFIDRPSQWLFRLTLKK